MMALPQLIIAPPEGHKGSVIIPSYRLLNIPLTESCWDRSVVTRGMGQFEGRAFWLHSHYRWVLGKDEYDQTILVPLTKETP